MVFWLGPDVREEAAGWERKNKYLSATTSLPRPFPPSVVVFWLGPDVREEKTVPKRKAFSVEFIGLLLLLVFHPVKGCSGLGQRRERRGWP